MEVCVDNIVSVVNACNGGAIRLELCTALSEGGLTPSVGFLIQTKKLAKIPVFVMIRPRTGNFTYNKDEIEMMKTDMKLLKENGADGFVVGVLNNIGKVDEHLCSEFIEIASPLSVTFHRAFDFTANPFEALESLIKLGFKRILTSGHQPTAEKGIGLIKELIEAARHRIVIMPGCGINEFNLSKILYETKAVEFHGSAKQRIDTIALANGLPYISSTSVIHNISVKCVCTAEEAVRRMSIIANESFKDLLKDSAVQH